VQAQKVKYKYVVKYNHTNFTVYITVNYSTEIFPFKAMLPCPVSPAERNR